MQHIYKHYMFSICINFPCSIFKPKNVHCPVVTVCHTCWVCMKCYETVAFSFQALEHITCHTLHTRFPRAAFFSATHCILQVDHLLKMFLRSFADIGCWSDQINPTYLGVVCNSHILFVYLRPSLTGVFWLFHWPVDSLKISLLSYHFTTHTFPSTLVTLLRQLYRAI